MQTRLSTLKSKTSPEYFNEIRLKSELSTASVVSAVVRMRKTVSNDSMNAKTSEFSRIPI
jgi:hypothetical protein